MTPDIKRLSWLLDKLNDCVMKEISDTELLNLIYDEITDYQVAFTKMSSNGRLTQVSVRPNNLYFKDILFRFSEDAGLSLVVCRDKENDGTTWGAYISRLILQNADCICINKVVSSTNSVILIGKNPFLWILEHE